ncbi:MAG TPA: type II toxin-antitoxin system RelE/ParE family toxin [Longimicrobium sp.]
MCFEVEYTDEFEEWWNSLDEDEQESIDSSVRLLELAGPRLPFPHSSGVRGSRHGHMRELRVQHRGRPFRVLYAFDPRRVAMLLIGGDKTGDDRWYDQYVPIADALYDMHLRELALEDEQWRRSMLN